jgi:5'-3' exoribonuclease 1
MSDVQNFKDMEIEFELGRPFLPFQQLLAVLPSFRLAGVLAFVSFVDEHLTFNNYFISFRSKDLLPKPFQELMTDETSPIVEYYPPNFQTDLNGKANDWEAVVLIPFIDEVSTSDDILRRCDLKLCRIGGAGGSD